MLTAPAAVLGHLGAINLKNLTKFKEVRKGADQAIWLFLFWIMKQTTKLGAISKRDIQVSLT